MAAPAKPPRHSLVRAFIAGSLSASVSFLVATNNIVWMSGSRPPPRTSLRAELLAALILGVLVGTLCIGGAWLLNRYRARRFRPPGSCRACGYDRAGLDPAAPCPECGSSLRPVA